MHVFECVYACGLDVCTCVLCVVCERMYVGACNVISSIFYNNSIYVHMYV